MYEPYHTIMMFTQDGVYSASSVLYWTGEQWTHKKQRAHAYIWQQHAVTEADRLRIALRKSPLMKSIQVISTGV